MAELRQKQECPLDRKVAPLLKVNVFLVGENYYISLNCVINTSTNFQLLVRCVSSDVEVPLTIWRPSEELRSMLSRPRIIVAIRRANVTSSRSGAISVR